VNAMHATGLAELFEMGYLATSRLSHEALRTAFSHHLWSVKGKA